MIAYRGTEGGVLTKAVQHQPNKRVRRHSGKKLNQERTRKQPGTNRETTPNQPKNYSQNTEKLNQINEKKRKLLDEIRPILKVCAKCHMVQKRTRFNHSCFNCGHPLDITVIT